MYIFQLVKNRLNFLIKNCFSVFDPEAFPGEINDFTSEQKSVEQSRSEDFII
jgi:hypothetical protein